MLIGHKGPPTTLNLAQPLVVNAGFHAFNLKIVMLNPKGQAAVTVDPKQGNNNVCSMQDLSLVGGGLTLANLQLARLQCVFVRDAAVAVNAKNVVKFSAGQDRVTDLANIERCHSGFCLRNVQSVCILGQRIVGVGTVMQIGEAQTCEVCNLVVQGSGQMGKVIAASPVILTGCIVEAFAPNLETGCAGKVLSVYTDKGLPKWPRGKIQPAAKTEPEPAARTEPEPAADGPDEDLLQPATVVSRVATPIEPEPEAGDPLLDLLISRPTTPISWFNSAGDLDLNTLFCSPNPTPFASPSRHKRAAEDPLMEGPAKK